MILWNKRKLNQFGRSSAAILLMGWITFYGFVASAQFNRQTADPLRLVSRSEAQVRCEIIFTNFANFVQNRQRILLTPLRDPELDSKFHTWVEKLNKTLKLADPNRADFDEISAAIDKLTPKETEEVLAEVASFYKEVTAEKYKAVKLKELKRTLDLILSRTSRPDRLFETVSKETSAWAIYSKYFKEARKNTGLPEDYSSQDVWNLLHWIRRRLETEAKHNPSLDGAEIVIYGSYVSGRAILGSSDIDALANSAKTSSFVDRLNEDSYFKKFNVDHIAANSSAKFSEYSAAQLSPVLFVVNPRQVIMKVYTPMTYSQITRKTSPARTKLYIFD